MCTSLFVGVLLFVAACAPPPLPGGGSHALHFRATGYFRTAFAAHRWWLVTPDGRPFYSSGVNHVSANPDTDRTNGRCPYCESIASKYASVDAWAGATVARLRAWGVNTIASWSDTERFETRMPYTSLLSMASGDDWFSAQFSEQAAAVAASTVAPRRDDPNLIGWLLDSELRWGPDWRAQTQLLDDYLALPAGSPGLAVAQRHAGDPHGFLRALATRYFKVTTDAVRAADPHHLILGVKMITQLAAREVLEAAAPYVDVFSVDDYTLLPGLDEQVQAAWGPFVPRDATLRAFYEALHKPLIVTEYSFRAADSGLPNTWPPIFPTLPTQADRARAYEQYVRSLHGAPWIVGDTWFEFVDEPSGGRFDGEDSNFGLVSTADVPWQTLVDEVTAMNAQAPDRLLPRYRPCWSWYRSRHDDHVRCVDPTAP
jgi:agarase